ncbi:unnamed protein product [Sphenostylis stenocarpa]|uniref:Uncharacterized protein n=1 Tax=Sphenostylis stenocarpa TaxID=92480 RepID=A0AA86T3X0_9FABA|nr:unnamed protein product [Sphenostylis stenocarpa]
MGVHDLWELFSPVSRRVSFKTLAEKTLAVDNPQTLFLLCEHMDGAVYESDARREGRNGSERPFAGLLPFHLQAYVPPHQASLCLRRWNPCPQASHCRRPPPPARKRLS